MERRAALADGVSACKGLTARYLAGFDDSTCTHQPPGLPNHVSWCLGHMAYVMHRAAERIDGAALPATDFVTGGRRDGGGDAQRFAAESVALGSTPVDDRAQYPGMARAAAIYEAACDRLATALRNASEEQLDKPLKWGTVTVPGYMLAMRLIWHNGDHTGQIADIRRSLRLPAIF